MASVYISIRQQAGINTNTCSSSLIHHIRHSPHLLDKNDYIQFINFEYVQVNHLSLWAEAMVSTVGLTRASIQGTHSINKPMKINTEVEMKTNFRRVALAGANRTLTTRVMEAVAILIQSARAKAVNMAIQANINKPPLVHLRERHIQASIKDLDNLAVRLLHSTMATVSFHLKKKVCNSCMHILLYVRKNANEFCSSSS